MDTRKQKGFTFIEILIVVVIISILAAIIGPRLIGRTYEARKTAAKQQIANLETALKLFKIDNGFYPSTDQGLEALVSKPATGRIPTRFREEGYLEKKSVPLDPWGRPYVYISPGLHGDYDIISYGADGEEGGEGNDADITSWTIE
ncbi:type II secretion system protein G precursor [bacterium BMS3Abin07]|nr:type II secretion system protein G precursor [bacterium BMS3Abin07]GBE32818.1 type II secretion system protein G precursor [bacterium BMS3Bbin05]HDO22204.1 type II secretion system protein GspG [Nitrospirota bacterium]HDZ87980.1 type II secretion system protein GspG [Nitrospirota bacterium]